MESAETETQVLHYFHQAKWPPGTIATQLGIHKSAVLRILAEKDVDTKKLPRARNTDEFLPFIQAKLEEFPKLDASRIYKMIKERGYKGGMSTVRRLLKDLRGRPAPKEAFLRLTTIEGEEVQVDWAHFDSFCFGRATRKLYAFVMVLSHSRAIFVQFFPSMDTGFFMEGHRNAYDFFGGCPKHALYDNLKSVVIKRLSGGIIQFNQDFLDFTGTYRVLPIAVGIAKGNEKGRVERAISYLRTSFWYGKRFKDLEEINKQVLTWCLTDAMERPWKEKSKKTVGEAFFEEAKALYPLPNDLPSCEQKKVVVAGKTPYVRFDCNDYSIPYAYVRKQLVVLASLNQVRIIDDNEVIATHARSFDHGLQIETAAHIAALRAQKSKAQKNSNMNRLVTMVPKSEQLLKECSARGKSLGQQARLLVELLAAYGASALLAAVEEALESDAPHAAGVRHVLERENDREGKLPALPIAQTEKTKSITVKPHSLASYSQLQGLVLEEGANHD